MGDLPYRTYGEMMGLVEEVDEVISRDAPPGVMYSLHIIGGVAMGAIFDARMTQDLDVATEGIPPEVVKAAEVVAKRHSMADNWINNQAAEFVDIDLPVDAFDILYAGQCLLVRGAKPEYLLAMKLMSGRGKDLPDILELAEATGAVTVEALVSLCDRAYAHTASYSLERPWVESVSADVASLLGRRRSGVDIAVELAALSEDYDGMGPGLTDP